MLIKLTDMYLYPDTHDVVINTENIVSIEPSRYYTDCCDVVVPSPAKSGYVTFTVQGTVAELYPKLTPEVKVML